MSHTVMTAESASPVLPDQFALSNGPRTRTAQSSSHLPCETQLGRGTDGPSMSGIVSRQSSWQPPSTAQRELEDWWICSTAIPLIAATIGPLANVLSIAALVTYWRVDLTGPTDTSPLPELSGVPFPDPTWCYDINAVSLACGFVGNLFLLANFTGRIRYIIALPATIILWLLATGMLIGILLAMNRYTPPIGPLQTYSQGFWYGVFAAGFYLISSTILMLNMLGHFLGHYGQHFNLTDSQRTLILQTMVFFVWLAGGAGIFAAVESSHGQAGWSFIDALYFCDVTILTVGFGDLTPSNNVGRGLVFPYSVGGIISLGLVISSLSRFATELSETNIIRKHAETRRVRTLQRSITLEQTQKQPSPHPVAATTISAPFDARKSSRPIPPARPKLLTEALKRTTRVLTTIPKRRSNLAILTQERDRFNAMRHIQASALRLRRYLALSLSILSFAILWLVGAAIFYATEQNTQGLSYFDALYFCYVSLLTIGYGDISPKSNVGRPFFVVWSLLAVPSMTILVSTLGDTLVRSFKEGTETVARFTILPQHGVWRRLYETARDYRIRRARRRRVNRGFETGCEDGVRKMGFANGDGYAEEDREEKKITLEELARSKAPNTLPSVTAALTKAIRRAAKDVREKRGMYSYEDWVEFTVLIRAAKRFRRQKGVTNRVVDQRDQAGHSSGHGEGASAHGDAEAESGSWSGSGSKSHRDETKATVDDSKVGEDDEIGLDDVDWDWIGEDSPMVGEMGEAEFVLDRLCQSLDRCLALRIEVDL